jgi:Cd2+/Zn2+-exporting ATPase
MKYTRKAENSTCCAHGCCASSPVPEVSSAAHLSGVDVRTSTRLHIMAMDCPAEARLIEKALQGMEGIAGLQFDFIERVLTIEHALPDMEAVIATLDRVGMQARVLDQRNTQPLTEPQPSFPVWFVLSGLFALGAETLSWRDLSPLAGWLLPFFSFLSIFTGGWPVLRKGWIALRSRVLNIHFLMMLAVIGALLLRQWPEAAMVLFLFGVAERLESMALTRAGAAVRELMALAPEQAWVSDGEGSWTELPVSRVGVGALLRVRPGEKVPLDGEIVDGYSSFNEASITGESLARDKGPGQGVFAGSINGEGVVQVRVQALAGDTLLARMIDCVRDAQGARAPTQRFIDRFSRYYTPAVVGCALLLAIFLPVLGVMSARDAVYQALVLLVIACPCALVIATPVALVSALAAAARSGILIKGGEALETAARVRVMAFDKTGTLTTGQARVVELVALDEPDTERMLVLAAALDADSTHPLALAVVAEALSRDLPLPEALQIREQSGIGVHGVIDGERYWLGGRRQVEQLGRLSPDLDASLNRLENKAYAILVLLSEHKVLGVMALTDSLRHEAPSTVAALRLEGVHCVLLSGDNPVLVAGVGRECAVNEAHGGLLPQEKLQQIERLQQDHGAVAMVGDGVNDAPALARADLGISMGLASDAALQTASVALMDNRLDNIPRMLAHARRCMRIVRCNLAIALLIKLVFFILALVGIATLWMAVFADVGTSLLVIANGLRLARSLDQAPLKLATPERA